MLFMHMGVHTFLAIVSAHSPIVDRSQTWTSLRGVIRWSMYVKPFVCVYVFVCVCVCACVCAYGCADLYGYMDLVMGIRMCSCGYVYLHVRVLERSHVLYTLLCVCL